MILGVKNIGTKRLTNKIYKKIAEKLDGTTEEALGDIILFDRDHTIEDYENYLGSNNNKSKIIDKPK